VVASETVQIAELGRELARAEKRASRRGRAEDWHRLRTTSRRLRGALLVHGEALGGELFARAARRAKRITKLPTEVRDLDVALENLAALVEASRGRERRAARKLLSALEHKRDRRAQNLARRLRRDRPARSLARKLRRGARRPAHPETPPALTLERCAQGVLAARAGVQGWRDEQALHALRVAVKKYRGALMAVGEGSEERLAALQTAQQLLGEHHDWSVLAGRLRKREQAARGRKARSAYRRLLARAEEEQRARFARYCAEVDDRLSSLIGARAPSRVRAAPLRRSPGRRFTASPPPGSSGSP